MEKQCFKCSAIKPIAEFYKHKAMADGYLGKCKECTKKDVADYRDSNLEKVREYDRSRPNHNERANQHLQRMNRIRLNEPEKFKRMARHKNDLNNKFKKAIKYAHYKVAKAIATGLINKPVNCSSCNSDSKLQGHHNDYSKPLDVVWLCVRCHADKHRKINEERRKEQKVI